MDLRIINGNLVDADYFGNKVNLINTVDIMQLDSMKTTFNILDRRKVNHFFIYIKGDILNRKFSINHDHGAHTHTATKRNSYNITSSGTTLSFTLGWSSVTVGSGKEVISATSSPKAVTIKINDVDLTSTIGNPNEESGYVSEKWGSGFGEWETGLIELKSEYLVTGENTITLTETESSGGNLYILVVVL